MVVPELGHLKAKRNVLASALREMRSRASQEAQAEIERWITQLEDDINERPRQLSLWEKQ